MIDGNRASSFCREQPERTSNDGLCETNRAAGFYGMQVTYSLLSLFEACNGLREFEMGRAPNFLVAGYLDYHAVDDFLKVSHCKGLRNATDLNLTCNFLSHSTHAATVGSLFGP